VVGGSLGRMLEHPPALPVPWPGFKRQAQKKPAERKGDARGRPSRCSPHPALVPGGSCWGCIVVGLKGAERALSEPRSRAARD